MSSRATRPEERTSAGEAAACNVDDPTAPKDPRVDDERHDTMPTDRPAAVTEAVPRLPFPISKTLLWGGAFVALVAVAGAVAKGRDLAGGCIGWMAQPAIADEAEKAAAGATEDATTDAAAAKATAGEALALAQQAVEAVQVIGKTFAESSEKAAKDRGISACIALRGRVLLLTDECEVPRAKTPRRPERTLPLVKSTELLQELAERSKR